MQNHDIRPATVSDLEEIRTWLKQEYDSNGEGFWVNIDDIEESQGDGSLTVLAIMPSDKPIAFCVASGDGIDIQSVKQEYRGAGYGRLLAKQVIATKRKSDLFGLRAQCRPEESLEFWKKMGFEEVRRKAKGVWIALPFRRRRELSRGPKVAVRVELSIEYPETIIQPAFETQAVLDDGVYLLEDEFSEYVESGDTIITIWVDGQQKFSSKLQYCDDYGVERSIPWVRVWDFEPPWSS